MAISASQVKELRQRTGAGMMECKKALTETSGDIDKAIELMRKAGMAKADKKADRVAAEGVIVLATDADGGKGVIVEVNCETDFVAKGDDFTDFAKATAQCALQSGATDAESLSAQSLADGGASVDERRRALISKIGENISVRRMHAVTADNGVVGSYLHGSRIGVLVALKGGDDPLARDIAMHIAASRPLCVSADDLPGDVLAKEKEIFSAQARESGKPENIIEKMVEGRVRKYLEEVTLVGQPFVKDPDLTVQKLLDNAGATVSSFVRFEVGEGIEKKEDNFVEEVMAQVKGG